jgi:hypothetical protein
MSVSGASLVGSANWRLSKAMVWFAVASGSFSVAARESLGSI